MVEVVEPVCANLGIGWRKWTGVSVKSVLLDSTGLHFGRKFGAVGAFVEPDFADFGAGRTFRGSVLVGRLSRERIRDLCRILRHHLLGEVSGSLST